MLPKEILKQGIIEKIKDIFWIYEERVAEKEVKPMVIAKDLVIVRNLEAANSEDIIKDFPVLELTPRLPQRNYEDLMKTMRHLSATKNRGYLKGTSYYEV